MSIEISIQRDQAGLSYFAVVITQANWSDDDNVIAFSYSNYDDASELIRLLLKSSGYESR